VALSPQIPSANNRQKSIDHVFLLMAISKSIRTVLSVSGGGLSTPVAQDGGAANTNEGGPEGQGGVRG